MNPILELARPDILSLQPYQHAAWEPSLERMHANEMPWRASGDTSAAGLNRYPEPQPAELIAHLAALYGVAPDNVLAGRGSDEGIDLLVRAFCRAGQDSVLICPPTFGMYKVSARIQGAGVVEVPLLKERGFALDAQAVLDAWRSSVKLVFLCTPNNPTGNLLERAAIESLCEQLRDRAIVVVDEAYIEFAGVASLKDRLERYPNLVILRTLSKAYALAGARCGALLAHADIVSLLARVITPYSLPTHTIEAVLKFTDGAHRAESQQRIGAIRSERARLSEQLARLPAIRRVWPSDSNFILVDCIDRRSRAARRHGRGPDHARSALAAGPRQQPADLRRHGRAERSAPAGHRAGDWSGRMSSTRRLHRSRRHADCPSTGRERHTPKPALAAGCRACAQDITHAGYELVMVAKQDSTTDFLRELFASQGMPSKPWSAPPTLTSVLTASAQPRRRGRRSRVASQLVFVQRPSLARRKRPTSTSKCGSTTSADPHQHRHRLLRSHAGADREARRLLAAALMRWRPAHRRASHGRGLRARSGTGVEAGARRQARHSSLRLPAADG